MFNVLSVILTRNGQRHCRRRDLSLPSTLVVPTLILRSLARYRNISSPFPYLAHSHYLYLFLVRHLHFVLISCRHRPAVAVRGAPQQVDAIRCDLMMVMKRDAASWMTTMSHGGLDVHGWWVSGCCSREQCRVNVHQWRHVGRPRPIQAYTSVYAMYSVHLELVGWVHDRASRDHTPRGSALH